jgi:hypothetical protein
MTKVPEVIQAIADRFGGEVLASGDTARVSAQGHRFLAQQTGGKHASFSLRLEDAGAQWPMSWSPPHADLDEAPLRCLWQPTIALSKEGMAHRVGRALRLNREIQVGDTRFDPQVYIDTAAPAEVVTRLLGRAGSREAVMALLQVFPQVSLYTEASPLTVSATGVMPAAVVANGAMQRWLEAMVALAQGLPAVEVQRPRQTPTRWTNVAAVTSCVASAAAFFLVICLQSWWELFDGALYGAGARAGLALWGVSLPALWWGLRGHSNSLTALLVSAGTLLLGLPCGVVFGVVAYNGLGDGPLEERAALVVARERVQGSKTTTYYATFDLRDGRTPAGRFAVSSSDYQRLPEGGEVTLRVGPGRLGYRWLDEILDEP